MNDDSSVLSALDYLRMSLASPVYQVANVTPLQKMEKLSHRLANHIVAKREDRQIVHSFKIRGAYSLIATLTEQQKQQGIITASAGNHAQGVALSAQQLGITAKIVMPTMTAAIKVDAVRQLGGQVILQGKNFDEAKSYAIAQAQQHGYTFIPPFDHPRVIAGQGTIATELLQQDSQLDRVFVPIGGGGLAAGIAVILKQLMPTVKIIGVEAEESACYSQALAVGYPIELPHVGLFAEGVAVKQIGDEPFRLCQAYLDDVITVSSDAICAATKDIFDDVRAIAEPSGALALAGLKKYVQTHQIQGERLAHIISGANINFHGLRYISERCALGEQQEALLAVTIEEKKGSFLRFCQCIGQRVVTEFNYRYADQGDKATIFVGLQLSQGETERQAIIGQLTQQGYQVHDLSHDEIAKLHVRYMIGGHPQRRLQERLFSFEFPESPGALLRFLQLLGSQWNITLFHYRGHGMDYGRVLAAFELQENDVCFDQHLQALGYRYQEESDNPAFHFFLAANRNPQVVANITESYSV